MRCRAAVAQEQNAVDSDFWSANTAGHSIHESNRMTDTQRIEKLEKDVKSLRMANTLCAGNHYKAFRQIEALKDEVEKLRAKSKQWDGNRS